VSKEKTEKECKEITKRGNVLIDYFGWKKFRLKYIGDFTYTNLLINKTFRVDSDGSVIEVKK